MASLFSSLRQRAERQQTVSLQEWADWLSYQGSVYGPFVGGSGSLSGNREEIASSFVGYVRSAYKSNGPVFSCLLVRMLLFSEARFQFRQLRSGRPGDYFGTQELGILERPWTNATTGDLLRRMELDASLSGNFYGVRRGAQIHRRRPDWMTIVLGESPDDPDELSLAGYLYQPGGPGSGRDPVPYLPEMVAHYAPIPDPEARYRGMSWLTPVVEEIMGDKAATDHKRRFFDQGATPNMIVKRSDDLNIDKFRAWVGMMRRESEGAENAYKTLYLTAGADATVVGNSFQEIDLKNVQGAGETRIAAAAGVPPIIAGFSEGLDAATYSNYEQAQRRFADLTMRPLWRDAAASLASLITVPSGSELWYDDRDIPFLAADIEKSAKLMQSQAESMNTLVSAGYDPATVVDAVTSGDLTRLAHSGLVSVQLMPPGSGASANGGNDQAALPSGRAEESWSAERLVAAFLGSEGDDG